MAKISFVKQMSFYPYRYRIESLYQAADKYILDDLKNECDQLLN